MSLDRAAIARLVPHAGAMCLLHEVLHADADSIRARAVNHRDASHPLRENGVLAAVCGVEYAAQAMALHGALQSGVARPGMLAALRDIDLFVERLDDVAGDLVVKARRLSPVGKDLLYEFQVSAEERPLLRGRAVVVTR